MKMIKYVWDKINGKKTIMGLLVSAAGGAMLVCPKPEVQAFGWYLLDVGLPMAGFGAIHKIIKYGRVNRAN